ncbi:hypothetical protein [Nonomuraea typhae]|uniref:Phage head morphogenesis domain-containing protein n=1 Tax=Nonomuraea typhae TaxID=2603600 RepID=A0ABW7YNI9_9ACTN
MASPQVEQLAERHRAQQVALRGAVTRDVVTLLRDLFDTDNADRMWPRIRSVLATTAKQRRDKSAAMANTYYDQARSEAEVPGFYLPVTPADLAEQLLRVVLDATGIAAFKRAIALGRSPEDALQLAEVSLAGAVSRLVLSGGRDAVLGNVQRDSQTIGWARITDKDPCAFCGMLASRGPVYMTKQTASFPAHDHCACMAVPVWNRDEAWLQHSRDLYEQWRQVTAGHSGADARRAWRRHWDSRQN